jgi:hypothetical protein
LSRKRGRKREETALTSVIEELANKVDELITRFAPPLRDPSDIIVVLVLLWMLSQSRAPLQQLSQHPIALPPPKKQYNTEELMNIIKQCEKSKEPLQCVKDMLYGG